MRRIFNVTVRNIRFRGQFQERRRHRFTRRAFTLSGGDRLIEHRRIRGETDADHIAVLFTAEQIPRAANFQIAHRDFKAGAEFGEFPNRVQAFFRRLIHNLIRTVQKIRERVALRTPHAPTHLVQLRETEAIRVIHDNGIGVRLVQSVFNQAGADEHIKIARVKIRHDSFQLFTGHRAVRDIKRDRRSDERFQLVHHVANRRDPIVHEIDLPAALHFRQNRIAQNRVRCFRHIRLHRLTIRRRRIHHRKLAHAGKRHMQRARDRRRRKREHINHRVARFPLFFLRHTEPLLFIDYQKSQIAELHRFIQQRVRAD